MKSLKNSLVLFLVVFTVGCVCPQLENPLTEFPPEPKYAVTSDVPVVSYDEVLKTYEITSSTLENFLLKKVYLDEVLFWKRENDIR